MPQHIIARAAWLYPSVNNRTHHSGEQKSLDVRVAAAAAGDDADVWTTASFMYSTVLSSDQGYNWLVLHVESVGRIRKAACNGASAVPERFTTERR